MSEFQEISVEQLEVNPFTLINKEWMLITAGDEQKCNTMTASWGGVGELWGNYVSFCFIRPTRYTLEFVENKEYYTLSFFDEAQRAALGYCGSHSGRDGDKIKAAGLTTAYDQAAPYFQEAKLVFVCRKLYGQNFDPACFVDKSIDGKMYPDHDYHKMFVGAIEKVLIRK